MNVLDDEQLQLPIDVVTVVRRSRAYLLRCDRLLSQHGGARATTCGGQALGTISRLGPVLTAEVLGALEGWLTGSEQRVELAIDPVAAAARALSAIEQSREAWLALVRMQQVGAMAAAPFVTDLVWLKHEVERAFPER